MLAVALFLAFMVWFGYKFPKTYLTMMVVLVLAVWGILAS